MSTPDITAAPQDDTASHAAHKSAETLYAIELLKRDIPVSGAERHAIAQAMHTSQIVPEHLRTVADIHGAYTAAIGLRISVYDVLQNLLIEDGKVAFKAAYMQARVEHAGHKLRVMEATKKFCRVRIIRNDDPEPYFVTYDWDDAVTAKLTHKLSWQKHPEEMLVARCVAKAVRRVCPAVLSGPAYTPEEFGAEVDEDGNVLAVPVALAAPVSPAAPPAKADTVPEIAHEITGGDVQQNDKQAALRNRIETAPDLAAVEEMRTEMGNWLSLELYDDRTTIGQALDQRSATLAHCAADDVIEVGVLNGDDEDDADFPAEAAMPEPGGWDAEAEAEAVPAPAAEQAPVAGTVYKMNPARRGLLAGLKDRAPDGDVDALVMARYGLPTDQVSNTLLIKLAAQTAGQR